MAIRLVESLQKEKKVVHYTGFKRTTKERALSTLKLFNFIEIKPKTIVVMQNLINFVEQEENRPQIFAEQALKIESFAKFVEILKKYREKRINHKILSEKLKKELDVNWKDSTGKFYTKIMLDWVRNANLVPKRFKKGLSTGQKELNSYLNNK